MVHTFQCLGVNVAVVYAANAAAAGEVCAECSEHGVTARAYQCDVASFSAVKETVARIKADFGTVQGYAYSVRLHKSQNDRNAVYRLSRWYRLDGGLDGGR